MTIVRRNLLIYACAIVLITSLSNAEAIPIANSLWIGNDQATIYPVLNTDLSGNVLRSFNSFAVGFAVDLNNNTLYVNDTLGAATPRNLTTLALQGTAVSIPVSEDLSFDGTYILAGDFSGQNVVRVNPSDGSIVSSVSVGFRPLGLTWDGGTGFWATPFASGGAVTHFDASGNVLSSFVPFVSDYAGGLGFDTTDGTLWVGSHAGNVFHYTTTGSLLGSFTTGDNRFVDGLEFQGTASVPSPATLPLLGIGLLGLIMSRRRKMICAHT